MTIKFNGKEYPARKILLNIEGYANPLIISVESLNDELMTEDGDYVSSRAKEIDETIYFYVPDDKIQLNDEELMQYVKAMAA